MASKISNFITKILLGILLIFMIAGVAVWGVNDIISGNRNKTIARVGNSKISDYELENGVQNYKSRLMQSGLNNISDEFKAVIKNNVLVNLIGDRLLQNEFRTLNLQLDGKEVLKRDYLSQPDFNKDKLKNIALSMGGEEAFLNKIIKDKKIDFLQGSITSVLPVNENTVKGEYNFENQSKSVNYVELSTNILKDAAEPSEKDLADFYEKNKDNFIAPEYRSASYIALDKSVASGADAVEKLHKMSSEIMDKIAGGETLEEISKEYNLTVKKLAPVTSEGALQDGTVVKDLPKVNNFVPALFATEQGEISDTLESDNGETYAFVRVDSIAEKRIKEMKEVKDFVVEGFKTKAKAEKLVEISKKLKEDLDSGKTTLEAFASQYGLEVKQKSGISSKSKEFSPELTNEIMNLKKGGYTSIGRNKDNTLVIAKVTGVESAKPAESMALFEYKSKVEEQVSQEIMAQYLDYLKQKYKVAVY